MEKFACIVTLLLLASVNGLRVNVLSPDGKYIPGSLLAWEGIFDEVKPYIDPAGHEYLLLWRNEIKPFDEALTNGDVDAICKTIRECIPHMRNLIPHAKVKFLQDKFMKTIAGSEKMLKLLETTKDFPLAARAYVDEQTCNAESCPM